MSRISNYEELVLEKQRLQQQLTIQKMELNSEIRALKEQWEPLTRIMGKVGGLFKKDDDASPSLLKTGVDLITKQSPLGKASWIAKLLVPVVAGTVSSFVKKKMKAKA